MKDHGTSPPAADAATADGPLHPERQRTMGDKSPKNTQKKTQQSQQKKAAGKKK
ncbi:MAG: hypothetical protein ACRDI2_19265 [Chloroflexota bacterium]